MKRKINISANLYDPSLLKTLVEKLASKNMELKNNHIVVPGKWKALETSSTMAYVMGTFSIQKKETGRKEISVPFTSCFIFTCTKEKHRKFELEWSASLS